MMNDVSETDTTDVSSTDSGINSIICDGEGREEGSTWEELGTPSSFEERFPQSRCNDALTELFLSHKKLKEGETQLRSLSLIVQQLGRDGSTTGVSHSMFLQNKHSLEEEVMRIRKEIFDKESFLQKNDVKLFAYYSDSMNENKSPNPHVSPRNEDSQRAEDGGKMIVNAASSQPDVLELNVSDLVVKDEKHLERFESNDKEEIARLRRALLETRQKHKEERDEIMKQLKALQVTAVNGETNWRCVLREKQLKVEELVKKNSELQAKIAELHSCLKNCEKVKQKEAKESERIKKKDEKIISSLRKQNASIDNERKLLLSQVEELTKTNEDLSQITERNQQLQKDFSTQSESVEDKDEILEYYCKEIKKTNSLVNNLVVEIHCLKTEKDKLSKQLEILGEEKLKVVNLKNDTRKCDIQVGLQTEDSCERLEIELKRLKSELELEQGKNEQRIHLETVKKKEFELEKESTEWRKKSCQNERTIQELIITFGKATTSEQMSCVKKIGRREDTRNIQPFSHGLQALLQQVKEEMNSMQEDFAKHREDVKSLQKTWRKYQRSLKEINEDLRR